MSSSTTERNSKAEEYFMRQALKVAEDALRVGEVPVGCVIVLRDATGPKDKDDAEKKSNASRNKSHEEDNFNDSWYESSSSVIISHGANQVNATRDATRHAECVAIDRMLTGGFTSDFSRLPQHIIAQASHGIMPNDCPLKNVTDKDAKFEDDWTNVKGDTGHWKNSYGWGSGRLFKRKHLQKCDLYVTCEPCIMCAAALARVGIGRVFFGCKNSRFGGNGSILSLHEESELPSKYHLGYPIVSGILENEAISLLRSFYNRENFHAPDEKRKRKPQNKEMPHTNESEEIMNKDTKA